VLAVEFRSMGISCSLPEVYLLNEKQPASATASLTSLNKGLGYLERSSTPEDIASLGWNLLREDLSLPAAVLYEDRLLHNLKWMQEFIAAYGVKLAPHGKTTMAPRLFELQLQAGAWGITLATAHQTLVAYEHGVRRVLMANQLVGKENMAIRILNTTASSIRLRRSINWERSSRRQDRG